MIIGINLKTYKKLNEKNIASKILGILEENGFMLEKLGYYEPIKIPDMREKALQELAYIIKKKKWTRKHY